MSHCPLIRRAFAALCGVLAATVFGACTAPPAAVSPAQIPELAARVRQEPQNGALLLRYAAALYSADRCDTALIVARGAMRLAPEDAVGPLVVGRCLAQRDSLGAAIGVYDSFVARHPNARGRSAVEAQRLLTERQQATEMARRDLQRESTLVKTPGDPQTVAVLPLSISGDTAYAPLSLGLAQMLTSDLALLRRFRMVERLELTALLDEMHLSETGRVDPQTAARVGHLVQAGRLVQGLAAITNPAAVHLEASVVRSDGEVTQPAATTGRFRDLLHMEKDLVIGIATRLGYTLSEAERTAILENGTQDMTAFLAYSRGLAAEDAGEFSAAATYFGAAVRADPNFQAARSSYRAAASAPAVQTASAGQVTTVAQHEVPALTNELEASVQGALSSSMLDLAGTQAEQTEASAQGPGIVTQTNAGNPPPPSVTPPATVTGTIIIVFHLP
jgi:tetratricopeptide (TPR) repeat protein